MQTMNSPKSAMHLFLQPSIPEELTKVAGEVALPDDPSMWEEEIIQEVHKQAPYVADFDIDVVLDKTDAEKGYGFGHIDVSNRSDMNTGASPEALSAGGVRSARIVIIINNKKLQPLDTLVTANSTMLPLTESRLRQSLFRPEIFDVTSKTPGDQSILSALYPPHRNASSFGGSGMVFPAGDSFAKQGSLLERIVPSMNVSDYTKTASELQSVSDQVLFNKDVFSPALNKLAKFNPQRQEKIASHLQELIKPTVGQITALEDGSYMYKAASHLMWEPSEVRMSRGHVYQVFGEKIALEADMHGSVTMVDGASEPALEQEEEPKLITEYGLYKVMTTDGKELVGFVFPNVLDYDGTLVPLALFTNGSESALQGEIMGNRVGSGASLIQGEPRGYGVFIKSTPDGTNLATTPIEISAHILDGDQRVYTGTTFDGHQLRIRQTPGTKVPVMTGENECILPEDFHWSTLDKSNAVKLVGNADEGVAKEASLLQRTLFLCSSGVDNFSLEGLDKVASHDLSQKDVLFLLGGYGLTPKYAQKKMAEAYQFSRPVPVHPMRNIKHASEVREESMKTASTIVGGIPNLRQLLVKEAAFIPDPLAVDTILSLGFINPENIQTFISYLPQMEQTQSRLCELLVAVRLGLSNVPVGAVERVVRSLETVMEGLKVMAFNE